MSSVLIGAALSLGAQGGGCAAEVQPGDGSAATWETSTVPVAKGADKPMTCEWLESNNCWKQVVTKVESCAPPSTGTFDGNRVNCAYPDGAVLELEGPISRPGVGSTLYPVVEHRLTSESGAPCFTSKLLGAGTNLLDAGGGTAVVIQTKSFTTYRVICPNGDSYADDIPGTCPDFGLRWLQHKAPGYTFKCEGTSNTCSLNFWTHPEEKVIGTCSG
ncbi:MAG: hypothetical protein SFV15_26770 [Polyangiaceae bacterium]|nr:hypothetical protein [Polyangiaceae bacterium]